MNYSFSSELTSTFTMTPRALNEDGTQDNVRELAQSYLMAKISE